MQTWHVELGIVTTALHHSAAFFIPLYVPSGNPVLEPHSHYARSIAQLSKWMLYVSLAIFLMVVSLIVYCHYKFKAKPGQPDPKPIYGNLKWEIAYIAGPVLLLAVIFGFTLHVMGTSDPPAQASGDDIVVTAHQWWWEFHYNKLGFTTANEVHIPVGRNTQFGLESADVIHDFWVPELARKEDVIPGRHGKLWFAADHPGTYLGTCAEFCGKEHAWMRIRVIAQTPADFAAWVAHEQQPSAIPQQAAASIGRQEFMSMPCADCHTIAGTSAKGRIGPDLTHVASRQTLAAGRLSNTPSNLTAWLHDPDEFKPGSHMPNLHLEDTKLYHIVDYLETLK